MSGQMTVPICYLLKEATTDCGFILIHLVRNIYLDWSTHKKQL